MQCLLGRIKQLNSFSSIQTIFIRYKNLTFASLTSSFQECLNGGLATSTTKSYNTFLRLFLSFPSFHQQLHFFRSNYTFCLHFFILHPNHFNYVNILKSIQINQSKSKLNIKSSLALLCLGRFVLDVMSFITTLGSKHPIRGDISSFFTGKDLH